MELGKTILTMIGLVLQYFIFILIGAVFGYLVGNIFLGIFCVTTLCFYLARREDIKNKKAGNLIQ